MTSLYEGRFLAILYYPVPGENVNGDSVRLENTVIYKKHVYKKHEDESIVM